MESTSQYYTAVIIDDEAKARRIMEALIMECCPEVKVLTVAEDVLTGIKAINKYNPDIVFLDIEMPGYTGFQLLDFFDEINFEVIFTTAYSEYALQAFQVSAVDYLLKPIQIEQLRTAVDKVSKLRGVHSQHERISALKVNLEEQHLKKIALPTSSGLLFIQVDNILYLEADGSYTHIYMKDGTKHLISKRIKEFENMLIRDIRFFRTHRSFLINTTCIKAYIKQDGGHIVMENDAIVHLSRERKDDFNKIISELKI
ncbi:MAG: LytTR family DNA-binding domain-containing protein [Bacteroidia bacterium]|jgi:two-component system LytT family response regulator|nr:LytTR family DNA-binding domain-containing protein [Bacteroidia bacterium]